jgi:hypothetical protein
MATTQHLTAIRGDDKLFDVTITDQDGNIVDITGFGAKFTVRKNYDDTTAIISKSSDSVTEIPFIDPTNGILRVILSNTDTNVTPCKYVYDVEMTDTLDRVITAVRGNFTIEADVSR